MTIALFILAYFAIGFVCAVIAYACDITFTSQFDTTLMMVAWPGMFPIWAAITIWDNGHPMRAIHRAVQFTAEKLTNFLNLNNEKKD